MAHFWQAPAWQGLRSGRWLTAERIRVYSLILLAFYAIAIVGWITLSGGLIDPNGKPIGTDFSSFYAAGSMVLDGHAADVYDMAAHYAREKQIFGDVTPYYGWLYPPIFLFAVAPLALMPYSLALAVWQGATFALYLAVIAAILRRIRRDDDRVARLWLSVAVAFPAAFINLGHGQNGFLTAGLFGAALLNLQRRPLLAGVLFGLLAYKPQFGVLIPFALLAGGQWRTFLAAGVTVMALAGAATLAFGPEIWHAFAASTETSRTLLLEQGNVGFEKLQSVFAAVRMWGGGISLAYVVQAAASVIALFGVDFALDLAIKWRPRSEGGAPDRRDLAGLAPCAGLRPDDARAGDRIHRRFALERRIPQLRCQRSRRGMVRAAVRTRHRGRDRCSPRPDCGSHAVLSGDAACHA